MNRNYEDWLKYYENATKEQVIEDMMLDINSIKEKDKEIERLKEVIQRNDKEIDNLCKNQKKEIERLNNIINELEKWCDIQFQIYKDLDKVQDSRISCQYLRMKDKLKELKEKSDKE